MPDHSTTVEIVKQRADVHRANPTYIESAFAERLDRAGIAYKFQEVIYPYIVDFLIGKLIIELDGKQHQTAEAKAYDARRDKYLRSKGYKLIRIKGRAVWSFDLRKLGGKRKKASKKQKARFHQERKREQMPREGGYSRLDRLADLEAVKPLGLA